MPEVVCGYWFVRIVRKDGTYPDDTKDLQAGLSKVGVTFVGYGHDGVFEPTVWLADNTMEIRFKERGSLVAVQAILNEFGYTDLCCLPGDLVWQGDWKSVSKYFWTARRLNLLLEIEIPMVEYVRIGNPGGMFGGGNISPHLDHLPMLVQELDGKYSVLLLRGGSCP